VSAQKRTAAMPQVPTMLEAGLRGDSVYPFYSGMFVPAKTPRAIVERLYQEAAKALQVPRVQAILAKLGVEPMSMTVEQFGTFFREDVEAAVALVEAAKIPKQ
jgi:tripartite-type tricarboxylate transporter receptor subunit TctC